MTIERATLKAVAITLGSNWFHPSLDVMLIGIHLNHAVVELGMAGLWIRSFVRSTEPNWLRKQVWPF